MPKQPKMEYIPPIIKSNYQNNYKYPVTYKIGPTIIRPPTTFK